MAKKKIIAGVIRMDCIAPKIYSMWLNVDSMVLDSHSGQFISLFSTDGDKLLPRPISICEIDRRKGLLRLVFRIAGAGTNEFSQLQKGEKIKIIGPLGNGFPVKENYNIPENKKQTILIGGGIGIPPMLQLAKELSGKKKIVLGYRNSQLFLKEEFKAYGDVYVATEDGSVGTKGNVLQVMTENKMNQTAGIIYACGPIPMLRGVKAYGEENKIETWISMEERMACGVGACLACVCHSKHIDEHSKVKNKRVCVDGPVFLASEVEL